MLPPQSSRARALFLLLAVLAPTISLLLVQFDRPIDVENHAMRSVGTPEAAAEDRRIASFGRDDVVVVAFQVLSIGTGVVTAVETDALEILIEDVEALPGVAEVREWGEHSAGARVYTVRLDAPGGHYAPIVERLDQFVRRGAPPSMRVAISGQPVADVVIAHEVQREQKRIAPLIAAGLIALLFLYYRHPGIVLAILAPAGVAIVWTGGAFVLLGRELDPISVMLQPVLMTVGVASGVHWIEGYLDELTAGRAPVEAARRAIHGLRRPAMLAGLTTVVGFLSLSFNSIPAVIDFGVFAALGVGLTYWSASFITPAMLQLFAARVPPRLLARRGATAGTLGRRTADWIARRSLAVKTAAVAITLASLVAWTNIEVDNDPQRLLPDSHPFRRETATVVAELGGVEVFDLLVPKGSSAANPARIALLAGAAVELEGVAGPAGPALLAENGDWSVRFLLARSGSSAREELFDAIEARARALGAGDVVVAGSSVQIARDSGRLVRSSLMGLGASMAALYCLFWAGFRSARYAWLAMVPNVMPCVIVYGGLAVIGRPLSVATAMISSVLLGLIVDDTIHLLHRYREQRASGAGSLASIEHVFEHSGRAVAITSVALGVGFSLTMFGRLSTTFEFGAVAAVTIGVAALCDLVLLPAILVKLRDADVSDAEPEAGHAG